MTLYAPRDIAPLLLGALGQMPVVVLTGLRQSGKTTLLQHQSELRARRFLTLDEFAHLDAVRRDPEGTLAGPEPVTLDEAHKLPEVLSVVKRLVDRERRPGRFLLSGSANFALLKDMTESLAGRAVYLELHPFTRREGQKSIEDPPFLKRFFEHPARPRGTEAAPSPIKPAEVFRGGMPSVRLGEVADAAVWFRGYEQTYLERDVRSLSQVADLISFRRLLRLAALRTGQVLNQSQLARDAHLNGATAGRYLSLMETSFVLRRLPPFLSNRASRLIKSPKLYVADSGLAAHLAGIASPDTEDPSWGALFETYVAQNLAGILASRWPEASLAFWNVQGRYEVDFIVEVGRDCVAIEIKAASRWSDRDLAPLAAFLAATPRCRAAILAHNGTESAGLGDRLWAIPLGVVLS